MRRVVVALGATLALLIVGSPVAAQQEVIDALRSDPLYVAPGVQDVDRDAVHQSIAQAAADGLDCTWPLSPRAMPSKLPT